MHAIAEAAGQPQAGGGAGSCIIAATPGGRTDDLCDAIAARGGHPRPEAWWRPATVQRRRAALGLEPSPRLPADYVRAQREHLGARCVMRADWSDFSWLLHSLRTVEEGPPALDADLVAGWFPGLVYAFVRPSDPAAQALAWWGEIHRSGGQAPAAKRRDFAEVRLLEGLVVEHDARWQAFFSRQGLEPLEIDDAAIAADAERSAAQVMALVGRDGAETAGRGSTPGASRTPRVDEGVLADYLADHDRWPSRLAASEPWLVSR